MSGEMEQVCALVREHKDDLAIVVNHSGGKDSTRTLGLVRKKFPNVRTYGVMADTGFEHKSPVSAADWARQRCADFGVDLTVVRNPNRTYLEMVEQRGMFPSAQYRQYTLDLKRGPTEKSTEACLRRSFSTAWASRAEEFNPRALLTPLILNRSLSTQQRTVYNWLSIFDLTLSDVLARHWV